MSDSREDFDTCDQLIEHLDDNTNHLIDGATYELIKLVWDKAHRAGRRTSPTNAVVPGTMIVGDSSIVNALANIRDSNFNAKTLRLIAATALSGSAQDSGKPVGIITSISPMDCTFTAVYQPETNGVTPKAFDKIGQNVYMKPISAVRGMSNIDREAFESRFPPPHGIYWDSKTVQYEAVNSCDDIKAERQHDDWLVWRTATIESTKSPRPEFSAVVPEWIKCHERSPTAGDADGGAAIWWRHKADSEPQLIYWADCPSWGGYWMPTGLKRPAPPEQEQEL
jgi:hypothetical protein